MADVADPSVQTARVTRLFEPGGDVPAEARGFARSTLEEWGVVPDETVLVVHELATAAALADAPFTVALSRRDYRVRIEVTGGGPPGGPAPSRPAATSDGAGGVGRSVVMVRTLSRAWGVLVQNRETVVWAEIDAHH